jgi:ABC-2 type transport system permease protein
VSATLPGTPAASPTPASAHYARGFGLEVRATLARCYVRVVGSIREPAWIISDSVFPALGMLAYVMLYRALGAPASYEALAVIGGILATYWLNVLWGMGAQLYWEKQQGQLQLYFAAPCSRMAILTGMALGGIVMTSARTVFAIALGFGVLGVRVQPFDPFALVGVFVLCMVALYALGMLLASVFLLWGREAWHLCNALTEPVYFCSGLYFPLRTLGGLAGISAGVLPLALGLDAMRQILQGAEARPFLPLGTEVLLLGLLAAVYWIVARLGLRHLESLSKREGRLTQRWQ